MSATVDREAATWSANMAAIEASRLRELSVKPLVMQPRNFGLVKDDSHSPPLIINRVEASALACVSHCRKHGLTLGILRQIQTNFPFSSRVKQIMVSEPIRYPHKDNFLYVNVLLMTEQTDMPLLIPYLYQGSLDKRRKDVPHNDLKEWLIINSNGERARLSTHKFHKM
ncbi:hypothetical protein HK105_201689 [Polyrhizophydium stewartii]|uniref:Uncharacterized protein n=1 Tax=Polyrhizophydium stewartii TaxID=2732419 RepID=A0ABR4NHC0_9FUNG